MERQNQNQKKNSFLDNYKIKVLSKLEREIDIVRGQSPSYLVYNRVFMRILDVIGWIIIAVFIYIWWEARGKTDILECSDITVNMCNTCFGQAKEIILNNMDKLNFSGLKLG